MKNIYFIAVALLGYLLLTNSCATIIHGQHQNIKIDSSPRGADVYINGKNMYMKTPCKIKLERRVRPTSNNERNQLNYSLKKEGYAEFRYTDDRAFNVVLPLFDALSIWPGVIDVAVGAHLKYERRIFAPLQKETQKTYNPEAVNVKKEDVASNTNSIDVDVNIPNVGKSVDNRYALIIGNEDYRSFQTGLSEEQNVKYAIRDASVFEEYAINVLGVPHSNIVFLKNAKAIDMQRAIEKMSLLMKATAGNAEVFMYYAGHGLPSESTKEGYLLPVDLTAGELKWATKLNDMYASLCKYPSRRVTVFIDACFSGGARQNSLVAARAVKIRPKISNLEGNLIVFSASSGEESALPYNEMKHGLFTYYLLKKLKETKGAVTYDELEAYLLEKVAVKSLLVNNKSQNPEMNFSPTINFDWRNTELR